MRAPDARALQATLGSLGLYSGDLDGVWGPLSQAAFDALVEGFRRCRPAPRLNRSMGWSWDQSEGALYFDGRWVARGYSGRGEGGTTRPWRRCAASGPSRPGAGASARRAPARGPARTSWT
ncbi:peptidoglycan-binding domain-containing protein [Brevundimonas denitrificans]|uniref:peptidoglycan-binding domain-containing protein n=1 Tax=Brevundimonas denitrificans TaxID=1443434 RepID=UPI00223BC0F8|nr:hypothetical protein [Brevundimonas denitrificans]